MKLTQRNVEAAKLPDSGQSFIRDDELPGFALRITAGGAKSFVWEGRYKGSVIRLTLGQYPALTVVAARRKAVEAKARVAGGEDPRCERKREREESTFKLLRESYMERHAKAHKKSWKTDAWLLEHYAPKSWDSRKLSDISRANVLKLHADIGNDHGHYAANHLTRLLRAMFNLARDWGLLDGDNPAARVKLFAEHKRERFLSPDELKRMNEALLEEPDWRWRAYFPLSLMLGTRRSELMAARWADINFEQRTWRIPETKAGKPHLLPLPTPAVETLQSLPSRGRDEWVFPASSASGHIVEPAKAWQRVRKRAGIPEVRIHDLRHTLASWMVGQGFTLSLIGRALNHRQASTTERYAHLELEPVRTALEQTAALMLGERRDPKAQTNP